MRDRSKKLLVINTGKKESGQTRLPAQSGTTHIIGGGGLSVNMSDYLLKSIWDKVFEIRTDSQGTEYIFGKLPVVTQYGITMYSGDGVDIPSLASGLPFDGRTIWYNPDTNQIEVIGGTGGGSGEGVSNFWDLSGIPSWITNSKPKYTYSEIEGTPDLTKYALVSQIPSLSGYATESWVNTKLEGYLPLSGGTLTGNLNLSYNKLYIGDGSDNYYIGWGANNCYVYQNYYGHYFTTKGERRLTIDGSGNVGIGTASPTYKLDVNGAISTSTELIVNGGKIKYDSTNKYWKLEGDLLVTGGVTMYGSDSSFTPSTIMDAILYDDTTLGINSNGQLYVKGGAGGGINTTDLQNYLTQNSYLNVTSGDNRYLKLSGGTLTGNLTIKTTAVIPLEVSSSGMGYKSYISYRNGESSGEDMGGLGFNGKNTPSFKTNSTDGGKEYKLLHENNYSSYALPLSGGILDGVLTLRASNSSSDSWIEFSNKSNSVVHKLGVRRPESTYGLQYYNGSEYYKIWHEGSDGSGSGLDADLLDGEHESTFAKWKSGIASSGEHRHIGYAYGANGWRTSGAAMSFGASKDYFMQIQGGGNEAKDVYLYVRYIYNAIYSDWKTIAFTDSNVASATKLQTARTIWGQSFDGTGNVDGRFKQSLTTSTGNVESFIIETNDIDTNWGVTNFKVKTTASSAESDSYYTTLLSLNAKNGNVGIGTTSPTKKLHIYDSNISNDSILLLEKGNAYDSRLELINSVDSLSFIQQSTGNAFISLRGKHSLIFETSNSARVTIDSSGNVGIGTTSPSSLLHVNGDGRITDIHFRGAYINLNRDGATSAIYDSTKTALEIEATQGVSILRTYNVTRQAYIALHTNGNIGIGTLSPSAKLHVSGDILATGSIRTNSNLTADGQVYVTGAVFYGSGSEGIYIHSTGINFHNSSNAWTASCVTFDRDGNINALHNLLVNGGITMYSQRSLKNIVDERGLSLTELSTIKPTRYTWKDGRDNRLHFGGIADDIQQVLPEVVYKTSDGILTMDYGNAAFAVASSLIKPVVDHEKRIATLEAENKQLRQEVERLKSA